MQKWEYMQIRFTLSVSVVAGHLKEGKATVDELLNQYGGQGWEVISVIQEPTDRAFNLVAFMKREKG